MTGPSRLRPLAGLFVTCLIDLWRPSVGFAAAKLIEQAGCDVVVPMGQTCCGQPGYNAGDRQVAIDLACQTISAFEGCDYVVVASGSCAGMLRRHYPKLLADDEAWAARAVAFAEKVHELTAFLCDVRGVGRLPAKCHMRAAYHDGCSGLREIMVEKQPRRLLAGVEGLEVVELADRGTCCGFGGAFAVKNPEISSAMADKKCQSASAAEADLLVATDLGCLLHLAGRLHRCGSSIEVRHVAEILADEMKSPPIGWR